MLHSTVRKIQNIAPRSRIFSQIFRESNFLLVKNFTLIDLTEKYLHGNEFLFFHTVCLEHKDFFFLDYWIMDTLTSQVLFRQKQ